MGAGTEEKIVKRLQVLIKVPVEAGYHKFVVSQIYIIL